MESLDTYPASLVGGLFWYFTSSCHLEVRPGNPAVHPLWNLPFTDLPFGCYLTDINININFINISLWQRFFQNCYKIMISVKKVFCTKLPAGRDLSQRIQSSGAAEWPLSAVTLGLVLELWTLRILELWIL